MCLLTIHLNKLYSRRIARRTPYPAVVSANPLLSLSGHQLINKTQEALRLDESFPKDKPSIILVCSMQKLFKCFFVVKVCDVYLTSYSFSLHICNLRNHDKTKQEPKPSIYSHICMK